MKTLLSEIFNTEKLTAIVTWSVVAISALYLMRESGDFDLQGMLLTALFFTVFLVSWMFGIRDKPYKNELPIRLILMFVQYASVLMIYFQVPYTYSAIMVVIWSGQLPYYMSIRTALLISPLYSAPMWLIYQFYWGKEFVFLNALLFWTFNLFALVTVNATLKEQRAREAANELNRELLATQALLSEATKQAERVRIARNIHDLLGHHLTAMTINLQVASRITQGQAKEKVDECHGLAKLLLSDVREAVSEIREKSNLQLKAALDALVDNAPQLNVELHYADDLHISDVNVAETIIRCVQESITNSLKHGNASEFKIALEEQNNHLNLTMEDNGQQTKPFIPGNGLKGIRERVDALGGQVNFDFSNSGFVTRIQLPEPV